MARTARTIDIRNTTTDGGVNAKTATAKRHHCLLLFGFGRLGRVLINARHPVSGVERTCPKAAGTSPFDPIAEVLDLEGERHKPSYRSVSPYVQLSRCSRSS